MNTKKINQKPKARGQTLVEFAFVFPIMLFVVFGIIEFGHMLIMYSSASNASRDALRYAINTGTSSNSLSYYLDCNGIRDAARRATMLMYLDDSDILISYDDGDHTNLLGDCNGNIGDLTTGGRNLANGDRIFVRVEADYAPFVPLVPIPNATMVFESARTLFITVYGMPECSDNVDNDGDGGTDYPDDPECEGPADPNESPMDDLGTECYLYSAVTSPSGIGTIIDTSGGYNCSAVGYTASTSFQVTAPDLSPSYTFTGWSGDVQVGSEMNNPLTVTFSNSDIALTANYSADCYVLTTAVDSTGLSGTITTSPTQSAGCSAPGEYVPGEVVTLTGEYGDGVALGQWRSTEGGASISTDNPYLYTTTSGAVTIYGYFQNASCYTLSISDPGGLGYTTDPAPNCNSGTQYTLNTPVTLTANTVVGYEFTDWSGDTSNPAVVTMSGDQSVTLNAVAKCYELATSVNNSSWGSIGISPTSPDGPCGAGFYQVNREVTLTANSSGPAFGYWDINGSTNTTNPITITMTEAKTVQAVFTSTLHLQGGTFALVTNDQGGGSYTATATITVVDQSAALVPGVTITGTWDAVNNVTVVTDGSGVATITSDAQGGCNVSSCYFLFTVKDMSLASYTYTDGNHTEFVSTTP